RFHTAHKLTLMAHSVAAYGALGQLVAGAKTAKRSDVETHYTRAFMTAMAAVATPRKQTNVLQHMAGYFKKSIDEGGKAELHATIEDYRTGLVPLVVPITLFRHYVR